MTGPPKDIDWNVALAPGYDWKEVYPLVTARAKEILSDDDFVGAIGTTALAREIGGPDAHNATRGNIIKGLRAGCRHELKHWHYRETVPNPYKKGETMKRYLFRGFVKPKPEQTCETCGALKSNWVIS